MIARLNPKDSDKLRKRIVWVIDRIIEKVEQVPPAVALAASSNREHQAAELIEASGLADDVGVPADLRPVFRRVDRDHDADGFPRIQVVSILSPEGTCSTTLFDWTACNAIWSRHGDHPEYVYDENTPHPVPDEAYVRHYVQCLRDWKDEALAPPGGIPAAPQPEITSLADEACIDPEDLANVLKAYQPPHMRDVLSEDEDYVLPFDGFITLYEAHIKAQRLQRRLVAQALGKGPTFSEDKIRWEISAIDAVRPFRKCFSAHLDRITRDHPEQLANVIAIRRDLVLYGDAEADKAADDALERLVELAHAYGPPPLGRFEVKRNAAGTPVTIDWRWEQPVGTSQSPADIAATLARLQPLVAAARHLRDALQNAAICCKPGLMKSEPAQLAAARLEECGQAMKTVLAETADDPLWTSDLQRVALELRGMTLPVPSGSNYLKLSGHVGTAVNMLLRAGVRVVDHVQSDADLTNQSVAQMVPGRAVDAIVEPKRGPRRPSDDAFKAWQIRYLLGGDKQGKIAQTMSEQLGRVVHQGTVSRWLASVERFLAGGGTMPPMDGRCAKPAIIDPSVLDQGERTDGRSRNLRTRPEE